MGRSSQAAYNRMYAQTKFKDEMRERRARGEEVRDIAHLVEIKERETAPLSARPLRERGVMPQTKTLAQILREASRLSEADYERMTPEEASEAERRAAERVRDLAAGWLAEAALEGAGSTPDVMRVLRENGVPTVKQERDPEPVSEARAEVLRENYNTAARAYGKHLGIPVRELDPNDPAPTAAQVDELMDSVEELRTREADRLRVGHDGKPATWTVQDIHGNDMEVKACSADGCEDGVTTGGLCPTCLGKGYVPLREAGLPVVKQRQPEPTLEDFRAFLTSRRAA